MASPDDYRHEAGYRRSEATKLLVPMKVSDAMLASITPQREPSPFPVSPFTAPSLAPGVIPAMPKGGAMAMDMALDYAPGTAASWGWANGANRFHEGVGFPGYVYLAELCQRSEYRRVGEIMGSEATRKGWKLYGDTDERLGELADELKRLKVREVIRRVVELDCGLGRGQIFVNVNDVISGNECAEPLPAIPEKVGKGTLRGFKTIEPMWSYPAPYESTNPLSPDYYNPVQWYVSGQVVHRDRLLTVVGHEVPDILKPAYAFGGVSVTQMMKPYVDNFIRNRQSASDLLKSFSVMVLKTDMGDALTGGIAKALLSRVDMANRYRDNRGMWVIDEKEEFSNVSAPLGGIEGLVDQSQEQICSVIRMPRIVYMGLSPTGLSASGEGEIRMFYDSVHGYQERSIREPLHRMMELAQLNLWGAVNPTIGFEFVPLWQMSATEEATIRKTDADTAAVYITNGVVDPAEERERLAEQDGGLYQGVDLSGAPPERPDETDNGEDTSGDDEADPSE